MSQVPKVRANLMVVEILRQAILSSAPSQPDTLLWQACQHGICIIALFTLVPQQVGNTKGGSWVDATASGFQLVWHHVGQQLVGPVRMWWCTWKAQSRTCRRALRRTACRQRRGRTRRSAAPGRQRPPASAPPPERCRAHLITCACQYGTLTNEYARYHRCPIVFFRGLSD